MSDQDKSQIQEPKKGFFGRLFEKLDKSLEEEAKKKPCCQPKDGKDGSSCC